MTGREGTTVGPYRLMRLLGGGYSGEVYQAEGPAEAGQSTGQVAIKLLRGAPTDANVRETLRQTQGAAQLGHPGIIPLYGLAQGTDAVGIVMAYARGGSLADTLSRGTAQLPLPLGVAARLVSQVARALDAAHLAGIAHGDIKPSNIFVRTGPHGGPVAVVGDFGQGGVGPAAVSLLRAGDGVPNEQARWAAEHVRFAAPEQLGGEVTPAADQYSLAALAYYVLTGRHHVAGNGPALLNAVAQGQVVPPSRVNSALPPEVDEVLLRGLARAPQQRYAGIVHFAQAFDETLAIALPAMGQAAGVTVGFAQLGGSQPGGGSGVRLVHAGTDGAAGGGMGPSGPLNPLPSDTATTGLQRRLALIAAAAVTFGLVACVFSLFTFGAFSPGSSFRKQLGSFGGPNAAPAVTATVDPAQAQLARDAETQLKDATAGNPAFSDALRDNAKNWTTDGKHALFKDGALHLANLDANGAFGVDAPNAPSAGTLAVKADVTLVRGGAGDFGGLQFLTSDNGDGTADGYTYVIAPEGYFQVWQHRPHDKITPWSVLRSGYSSALKTGLHQTNTLSVLTHGRDHTANLYANGHFVSQVTLPDDGPTDGGTGLIVMTSSTEIAANAFAVYTPAK